MDLMAMGTHPTPALHPTRGMVAACPRPSSMHPARAMRHITPSTQGLGLGLGLWVLRTPEPTLRTLEPILCTLVLVDFVVAPCSLRCPHCPCSRWLPVDAPAQRLLPLPQLARRRRGSGGTLWAVGHPVVVVVVGLVEVEVEGLVVAAVAVVPAVWVGPPLPAHLVGPGHTGRTRGRTGATSNPMAARLAAVAVGAVGAVGAVVVELAFQLPPT